MATGTVSGDPGLMAGKVAVTPTVEIQEDLYVGWRAVCSEPEFTGWSEASARPNRGHAFGNAHATGDVPQERPATGFEGKRLIDSRRRGLGTFTGELRSDVFEIRGDRLDFLIGGGRYPNMTCLNLHVRTDSGFERVHSATGANNLHLMRREWDVSAWKGREAYLEILDLAPIEPFLHTGGLAAEDQRFGFILVDDIRQLDAQGNRTSQAYDLERNFNFERVGTPQFPVRAEAPETLKSGAARQRFAVGAQGVFTVTTQAARIGNSLHRVEMECAYAGKPLTGVKLAVTASIPIPLDRCQYYLFPGVLYNGNRIGQATHYFGEDFPEDALTVPGGFAIEDTERVFGGWVAPQKGQGDPRVSVRLQKNFAENCYEAVYLIPDSAQYGHTGDMDWDNRLDAQDGFHLRKTFYFYAGKKRSVAPLSNEKQSYAQVVHAAWDNLYPQSPTNPPHTLTEDYDLRLKTLLDPYALMQDVTANGKTYRIWFVGRWTLPDRFDFAANPLVPMRLFHRYTGFSWSGMLGLVSYTALKEHLKTGDPEARRVAMDTLDFFADNGMSPLGILYGAYYPLNADGGHGQGFGTYAQVGAIDMMPLGEETYWYVRCYELLKSKGVADKQNWLRGVRRSLDRIRELFPDGNVPGRIDGTTGKAVSRFVPLLAWKETGEAYVKGGQAFYDKPSEGGPTGFIYLIWGYCAYYQLTKERGYLEYAERLGERLLSVMNAYGVMAGAEMDWFNVDKRMPHAALAAFNHLYAATGSKRWLKAAELAANLFATWQYAYNVDFAGHEPLPLGHFKYHSVGGTPVSVIAQTNNLAFNQGATEYLRLWNATGQKRWFERARALLHQGTESTLTEEKRRWLNAHFQGPGIDQIREFNPNAEFDSHVLGGGTEDVLLSWKWKGYWTSKHAPILSMYMLAQSFDWDDIRKQFGSLTYSFKWNYGSALDTLDQVRCNRKDGLLLIAARNMMPNAQTYLLRLLDFSGSSVTVAGISYDRQAITQGIPLRFGPKERRRIVVGL